MNRLLLWTSVVTLLGFSVLLGAACGQEVEIGPPPGLGRLAIDVADAPAQLKEINVTVAQVTAHSAEAGWVKVFDGKLTIDLLKLREYALPLGFKDLPEGKITQIRLITLAGGTHEVVMENKDRFPLKVPSGLQSGIKIKGPFAIKACHKTAVTLDFDGTKSIWTHPTTQGEEWVLRPVIHLKKLVTKELPCEELGADGGTTGTPEGGILQGAGGACTAHTGCLSGSCVGGSCAAGGPGVPCRVGPDCVSALCQADGTCANGSAGGTGSSCAINTDCLSNSCVLGVCETGNQGAPCKVPGDCASGYACEAGFCQPIVN